MSNYQKITTLQNEIQARLLDAELKKRNIPHFLRTYHDAAYNGIYQQQKGWGIIEAPIEYKEEILSVLTDIEK
ncbi:MAG: hypothetical protein KAU06_02645 [Candidatus Marinimicrobia bacterium]|nr:hypothetical protein [Candidatus Neomarinimicrobiota bacterium]